MKKWCIIFILFSMVVGFSFALEENDDYFNYYTASLKEFQQQQQSLRELVSRTGTASDSGRIKILEEIKSCRLKLKAIDLWLRYLEPIQYRRINGPLPVEWETEVFEKYEPPYRREGGGLSLAEELLEEENPSADSLLSLINASLDAMATFQADSIAGQLKSYHHFFLANRLFLLNLASIYTTGFECPDSSRIIPELRFMMLATKKIYAAFNKSYPATSLTKDYLEQYDRAIDFVDNQPTQFSNFDHFAFIKDHVNPLFRMNQEFIAAYKARTISMMDFSINNHVPSLFDKKLFVAQNTKGIFSLVEDERTLSEIRKMGNLLFFDPILSGNNKRSCASCHKPEQYFTDTGLSTPLHFDQQNHLPRNAPSLINAVFNHLVMQDGKHISLQGQAKDVILNPDEMGSTEEQLLKKVMSCRDYKKAFQSFARLTPEEKKLSLSHIVSAITFYYADYSFFDSHFDRAMNNREQVSESEKRGFNIFMSKAQCGTCHFVPQFNGAKPPFTGSEFEVLGVPADSNYHKLSPDQGRFGVHPVPEMKHAFRTGSVRNTAFTKPYMHNGVFQSLEQVIDLYDAGGGVGKKLKVDNQTLPRDSLHLSIREKEDLMAFLHSLNENIIFEEAPAALPVSSDKKLNRRKPGGEY